MADHAQRSNVEADDWQLQEIAAGLAELDSGKMVEHEKVVKWPLPNRETAR
jgi:predicted transcriptional regulator